LKKYQFQISQLFFQILFFTADDSFADHVSCIVFQSLNELLQKWR